ncbi:MAG: hypothetical protein RSE54_10445, partial [Ruthenibacterium sp.]
MGAITKAWTRAWAADVTKTNLTAQAFGLHALTTDAMADAVAEWFSLYFRREPDDVEDPCQRLPYTIVHKLQKTVFAEYVSSIANAQGSKGGKTNWMDANRRAADKIKKQAMQWALVGGAVLLKPVPDVEHFHFTALRRDAYVVFGRGPGGELTDVGCCEFTDADKHHYTLAERRTVTPEGVGIRYRLYQSETRGVLGRRVPLSALSAYAQLPEQMTLPGVHGIGLVEMRLPMANCVDGSEDGVSVYAAAMGLIHNINRNERQYDAEFENGRSRVFASSDVLETDENGRRHLADDIFEGIDDSSHNVGVTVYNPTLRDESFERRKQSYLKACENIIGLKRGILSDIEAAERTATEITSSDGDYNLSIVDLQNMWFDALR